MPILETVPPARAAPSFAASINPGPPPVMTAQPISASCLARSRTAACTQWSRGMRAEPKMETRNSDRRVGVNRVRSFTTSQSPNTDCRIENLVFIVQGDRIYCAQIGCVLRHGSVNSTYFPAIPNSIQRNCDLPPFEPEIRPWSDRSPAPKLVDYLAGTDEKNCTSGRQRSIER